MNPNIETLAKQLDQLADAAQNATLPVETPGSLPAQREPLVGSHSYYRSKLFSINIDMNPLVAAAAPLLTLAGKLNQCTHSPNLQQLQKDLIHEMKAFESRAQNTHYRSNVILVARYALCTLLDEMIIHSSWNTTEAWEQHALLYIFQREHRGGERFFNLLERSLEDAHLHLDLLELMFVCLRLGLEGPYREQPRGHIALNKRIDNLYHCLQRLRSKENTGLSISIKKQQTAPAQKTSHSPTWASAWALICLCIILSALTYTGLNYSLQQAIHPVASSLQQLTQANSPMTTQTPPNKR